ncbi:hypothetical protein [Sphingomonas changbaiensis]|nr:hypothetical protein [Sphingomonas changbaiensis]
MPLSLMPPLASLDMPEPEVPLDMLPLRDMPEPDVPLFMLPDMPELDVPLFMLPDVPVAPVMPLLPVPDPLPVWASATEAISAADAAPAIKKFRFMS